MRLGTTRWCDASWRERRQPGAPTGARSTGPRAPRDSGGATTHSPWRLLTCRPPKAQQCVAPPAGSSTARNGSRSTTTIEKLASKSTKRLLLARIAR